MWMLATIVDANILQQLSAQTVLGKHTLDSLDKQWVHTLLEVLLERLLLKHQWGSKALSTGIACVTHILLVSPLVAGEHDFVSIDYDHVVATVHVRSVAWFVLASQDFRNLRAQAAKNLVGGINHDPFFLYCFGFSRDGFVT